jgi:hypothetical protein
MIAGLQTAAAFEGNFTEECKTCQPSSHFHLAFSLLVVTNTVTGARNMKFCMRIDYRHSYKLCMKCCL